MLLSGSEIVVECLKEQGVDTVFGYPGGTILNVYDALYKHSEIKHILTSHEQGASHAADGYARSTGKVGVCMATSGPGATNLVTGIATAYMDSVPMVAITANVVLPWLGKDTFQEVDIAGVTMPITKHGYIVKDVNEVADTIIKYAKNVLAVDLFQENLDRLNSKKINTLCADIANLKSVKSGSFDVVFVNGPMSHLFSAMVAQEWRAA